MVDKIEEEREIGSPEYKFEEFLSQISSTAIARFLYVLIGSSVIAIGVNVAILNYFLSELTDQLDQRIESTNKTIAEYKIGSDQIRSEAVNVAASQAETISEIRERLARIEAQSELSSSILIGVRDGEQSLPRLEDQLPDLESFLEDFVPMGGAGVAANYAFPPARKILPFDIPTSQLEREKQLLADRFELALTGGLGPQIDRQVHTIDVRHGMFYNGNRDEMVIVIVAYVLE